LVKNNESSLTVRFELVAQSVKKFLPDVNRKLVKHPIMTYIYGSGILTRCQTYTDSFLEQAVNDKLQISSEISTISDVFLLILMMSFDFGLKTIYQKRGYYISSFIIVEKLALHQKPYIVHM
jgi:hypothetical protein